ncbi:sigma-E factor negative regulatory protein RseA [Oxalobacteraceae bacterium GrIS 2.11]
MNNDQRNLQIREKISSLVDGEYGAHDLDLLITALHGDASKKDWEIYHQIGDVLNSDHLSISISPDFNRQMDALLASEVTYFNSRRKLLDRFNHRITYASAAMIALMAILVPKFAGHDGAEVSAPYITAQLPAFGTALQAQSGSVVTASQIDTPTAGRPRMLRDPSIDSYLAAHQRYSKSMYSAVEYETGPIVQEVEK